MDTEILQHIGHSLYNTKRLKEWKRYVVFRSRCMLHSEQIGGLLDFFAATPLRRDMLRHTTSFVEQATRQFFYKNSTYDERISLVKGHVEFLESKLTEDALRRLYADGEMLRLWEDSYEEKPLTLELWFHAGQRKEGCLSLVLMWDKEALYQIMFWLAPGKNGEPAQETAPVQRRDADPELGRQLQPGRHGHGLHGSGLPGREKRPDRLQNCR